MKFFHILVSTVLTASLLFPPSALAAFSDVPTSHDNFDGISYVQEEGIVKGYADGSFKPDLPINRAEFTKIIVEAVTEQVTPGSGEKCFSDVERSAWFYHYVCFAKTQGILGGYPDGSFKPAQNITFVEASKIISNSFGYQTGTHEVWYKPSVDVLAGKNAIPSTVGTFTKNITRGEMAEMIYRLKNGITNKSSTNYNTLSGKFVTEERPAQTIHVSITSSSFGPERTINVGDTVVWTNEDTMAHSIRGAFIPGGESNRLNNGHTFEHMFQEVGTFNYDCGIHGSMTGKIIVKP
jgi:plastocyanin